MSKDKLPILVDLHKNVYFDDEKDEVSILDRRKLPQKISEYRCENYRQVARAIEKMVTQSLGVSPAGGYGITIAAHEAQNKGEEAQKKIISNAVERIKNTRPTQTSLHYLADKMGNKAQKIIDDGGELFEAMFKEAYSWTEQLMVTSRKLGKYASNLIKDGNTVLTHCYGGPAIYFMGDYARRDGKEIDYLATETRPYLQGTRLTSFALNQGGFDVTLITDGMPAHCMKEGLIDKFITGADRISMDGGVANKIGTYQILLAANKHGIPFYAISYTGPDPNTQTFEDIEIEERDPKEIKEIHGIKISPEEIDAFYPAFDCTPPDYVEGVITPNGTYSPDAISGYFIEE